MYKYIDNYYKNKMAFQKHDYPNDMVLLGIALPIVWVLTVASKKGIQLKHLCRPLFLGVASFMLCGQYFYYLVFTQCCVTPFWGALGYSLFHLLMGDDDAFILDMARAFILEYALLSTPTALYAVGGATLWILSVAIGSTLRRHL